MRYVALLLLLAACSKNSTGPSGVDPTVLIANGLSVDSVFFTWRDGQGVVGADTVLPGRTVCAAFTARPDSAYFQGVASYLGQTTTYTAPWFNPADHPAYTMTVQHTQPGSPDFLVYEVATPPC